MSIINKLKNFIIDPVIRMGYLDKIGFYRRMTDEKYLKKKFKTVFKSDLNLDNPQTFNEKLQWLKLYDKKPEYTIMVDKYKVREYIAKKIGEEYLIPLLGVWGSPDEIDFDKLPNQFVLKCNHNSGLGMCICRDKSKLNISNVKKELRKGLKQNYYWSGREWPYKNVPPRIIAEKYMEDSSTAELRDYKFLCFNGEPKVIEIHSNRFSTAHTQDFYDIKWKPLQISQGAKSSKPIECPLNLDKMIEFSKALSNDMEHVRVDWYEVSGQLYFGEITFYDGSGFEPFDDIESDLELGKLIRITQIRS